MIRRDVQIQLLEPAGTGGIDIRYDKVTLTVITHDFGGLRI
jgi:hypothetical protein